MPARGKRETNLKHQASYRAKHRKELALKQREIRLVLKQEILQHYGLCCPCGYSDSRALQIDHIDNNGAVERKGLGGQNFSGQTFYRWLKRNGWPPGYQTLCANCNAIKHIESKNKRT